MRAIYPPKSEYDRSLLGFYCYTCAVEVFGCVSITVFLPVILERKLTMAVGMSQSGHKDAHPSIRLIELARRHGYRSEDHALACDSDGSSGICSVALLGGWIHTTSFSLYVKSASVAVQAVLVISLSSLADISFWRKRLLLAFAYVGAGSAITFILLPISSHVSLFLAAFMAISSTVAFGSSFVCLNAFLPGLVRAHPDVEAIAGTDGNCEGGAGAIQRDSLDEETESLLGSQAVDLDSTAILGARNVNRPTCTRTSEAEAARLSASISALTSTVSSTAVALGYTAGTSILALTIIPVTLMEGSLLSLQLAIFISGAWWAAFTFPAAVWLPGSDGSDGSARGTATVKAKVIEGWTKLGHMFKGDEIRRLPSTYWYLLAWALLADAFNTTASIAILFGKVTLSMSSSHVILIGILSQATSVLSAYYTPAIQRRLGWSSMGVMIASVVGVMGMCGYGMLGLVEGVTIGGLRTEGEMYACAIWFGIMYGPFVSMSRTVFVEIIPEGHEARFFSLFSICDKGASWLGPGTIALIADKTGEVRHGFVFLAGLLAVSLPVLAWKVDVVRGREDAGRYAVEEREKRSVGFGGDEVHGTSGMIV